MKRNGLALIAIAAASTLMFQNCGNAKFSGSSVQANAATTSPSSTSSSSSSSSTSTTILGTISLADVSKIEFEADLNTKLIGLFAFQSVLTLNDTAQTYAATMKATGPIATITLASCVANGSNLDYSALEANLAAMKFKTTESSSSPIPDFGSMTLSFLLKDGTTQTFKLDNDTTSVSVSGVTLVSAASLISQFQTIAHSASCTASLPF